MSIASLSKTWCAVSQFHEREELIALAQKPLGRFLVWTLAFVLLLPSENPVFVVAAVALAMFLPSHRRLILSIGSAIALAGVRLVSGQLVVAGLLYLGFLVSKYLAQLPRLFRRSPQIWLHLLLWVALLALWKTPADSAAWRLFLAPICFTFPHLMWRCGYLLKAGKRDTAAATGFQDHFFYLWPIYGGGSAALGKGFDYLSQREARSADKFARVQLAGIKVLVLGVVWKVVLMFVDAVVYGYPNEFARFLPASDAVFPTLEQLINGSVTVSVSAAWLAIYADLVRHTLVIAVEGHFVVGALRLFGFNVFRNTYKPLLAESLLDFWNRFHHYYKEVLVEFFFFPTYLRYFKKRPNLRIFSAVFVAAFVGNMYHHVLMEDISLVAGNFTEIWQALNSRLLYCLLLSVGIFVSMLRQQKQRGSVASLQGKGTRFRRLRRIAGVWTFYSIIHVWSRPAIDLTFLDRTSFVLSLFGLAGVLPT